MSDDPNLPDTSNGDFYCHYCESSMNSERMWTSHIVGKKHIKKVQKGKKGSLKRKLEDDDYLKPTKIDRYDRKRDNEYLDLSPKSFADATISEVRKDRVLYKKRDEHLEREDFYRHTSSKKYDAYYEKKKIPDEKYKSFISDDEKAFESDNYTRRHNSGSTNKHLDEITDTQRHYAKINNEPLKKDNAYYEKRKNSPDHQHNSYISGKEKALGADNFVRRRDHQSSADRHLKVSTKDETSDVQSHHSKMNRESLRKDDTYYEKKKSSSNEKRHVYISDKGKRFGTDNFVRRRDNDTVTKDGSKSYRKSPKIAEKFIESIKHLLNNNKLDSKNEKQENSGVHTGTSSNEKLSQQVVKRGSDACDFMEMIDTLSNKPFFKVVNSKLKKMMISDLQEVNLLSQLIVTAQFVLRNRMDPHLQAEINKQLNQRTGQNMEHDFLNTEISANSAVNHQKQISSVLPESANSADSHTYQNMYDSAASTMQFSRDKRDSGLSTVGSSYSLNAPVQQTSNQQQEYQSSSFLTSGNVTSSTSQAQMSSYNLSAYSQPHSSTFNSTASQLSTHQQSSGYQTNSLVSHDIASSVSQTQSYGHQIAQEQQSTYNTSHSEPSVYLKKSFIAPKSAESVNPQSSYQQNQSTYQGIESSIPTTNAYSSTQQKANRYSLTASQQQNIQQHSFTYTNSRLPDKSQTVEGKKNADISQIVNYWNKLTGTSPAASSSEYNNHL